MVCIPLLANPVGWVILGVGGFALYKLGKKKGEEESAVVETATVSGAKTEAPAHERKEAPAKKSAEKSAEKMEKTADKFKKADDSKTEKK